jgi:biopolymer transport protein ExbD
MKIASHNSAVMEGDMTPMIDMSFQLIAFLMVLVNFTADDVSARVVLPESEMARPPQGAPAEDRIIIQLDAIGSIIYGAEQKLSIDGLKTHLANEAYLLQTREKTPADATVIIRAHKDCQTGKVQEVIKACQEKKFEKFILRAKEQSSQ